MREPSSHEVTGNQARLQVEPALDWTVEPAFYRGIASQYTNLSEPEKKQRALVEGIGWRNVVTRTST